MAAVSGLREAFVTVRQTNAAHVFALDALERVFTAETALRQTNAAHVSALDALERVFNAETVLFGCVSRFHSSSDQK